MRRVNVELGAESGMFRKVTREIGGFTDYSFKMTVHDSPSLGELCISAETCNTND